MSRRKKTEAAVKRDEIGRLYLAKKTQTEIGGIVGLTQQSVSLHLKALRTRWLESADIDFSQARAEEVAKLDNLERLAYEEWALSTKPKTTITIEEALGVETKKQTRTEIQYGNPKFLDIIHKCVAKRCELLGVAAPTKVAVTTPNGKHPAEGLGLVGLLREAKRIKAEAKTVSIQEKIYERVINATK